MVTIFSFSYTFLFVMPNIIECNKIMSLACLSYCIIMYICTRGSHVQALIEHPSLSGCCLTTDFYKAYTHIWIFCNLIGLEGWFWWCYILLDVHPGCFPCGLNSNSDARHVNCNEIYLRCCHFQPATNLYSTNAKKNFKHMK